jgi:glucose-6-phosphate isomerase
MKLRELPAWRELVRHQARLAGVRLQDLLAADAKRPRRFVLGAAGLELDYSRHRIDAPVLDALIDLARARQLDTWIERLFAGEAVNFTEQRAALHVALRAEVDDPVADRGIREAVAGARSAMRSMAERLRDGAWRGASGATIHTVVSIGIGGSDLGPRLVTQALRPYQSGAVALRFAANIDPADLDAALSGLDPARTLFIVISKSFRTQETITNAQAARAWLAAGGIKETGPHFVAVTANRAAAEAFGVARENCLPIWDWVGGRYSLWSAVGLPIAIALGMEQFEELLLGARDMDQHFRAAPFERNMPVLLALLSVWYVNFCNAESHAVLPYAQDLSRLPAYLQQLEMESNGKSVNQHGIPIDYATAPIVWGEPGTNGQHSFHQLLHQGTRLVPADFLLPVHGAHGADARRHSLLLANALAQSAALALGATAGGAQVDAAHFDGNRPSSVLLFERLNARNLGRILALYEHKVFTQGVIWGVNSFDQLGVELGKTLAEQIAPALFGQPLNAALDAGTQRLLHRITRWGETEG